MNEMRKLMNVAGLLTENVQDDGKSIMIGRGPDRIRVQYLGVPEDQRGEVQRLASRIAQLQKGTISSSFEQSRANKELIRSIIRNLQTLGAEISYPVSR